MIIFKQTAITMIFLMMTLLVSSQIEEEVRVMRRSVLSSLDHLPPTQMINTIQLTDTQHEILSFGIPLDYQLSNLN